jgi:two-component system, cell cycle sensor histidine kinase and response regulator CckA
MRDSMQPFKEERRPALPPAEAESALRATEERYRTIVTTAAEGIWTLDAEARTTFVNDRLASMLGYRAEEMLGRKLYDFMDREARDRAARTFMRRERRSGGEGDFRFRRQDGSVVWLRPATSPLLGPRGEFVGALAMVSDVTERRRAEENLARLAAIVESSEDAIFTAGLNGTILTWNAGAERLFGYRPSEAIGCHVAIVVPPSQAAETGRISRLIRDGQAVRDLETVRRRKDGSEVVVSLSLSPLRDSDGRLTGASAIARDITEISKVEDERRQLEDQLRQAQKMEAVGRLAGGVAHDFNNYLTAILGYSEILAHELGPRHPALDRVEQIHQAGERAAALTRQLLALSRRQNLEPEVLDLAELVRGLLAMIGRLLGEHIRLTLVAAPGLGRVEADRGQLEQVILNLAVNARDAMPEGGSLTFELCDVELDRVQASTRVGLRPGPHVVLKVSDTGLGMDAKVLERIFEPFFTTKARGKGTGLGLSTVHGIVLQSNGAISVTSAPGRGTAFEIHLPRAAAAVATPASPPNGPRPAPRPPLRGSETILLVEDETCVRNLLRETLRANGYTVLAATDPGDAERLAKSHRGPIHLLLTDVVMPGRNGRALAEELRRLRPALRVLFMSGHEEHPVPPAAPLPGGTAFLAKPFLPQDLARKLREVLATPGAPTR